VLSQFFLYNSLVVAIGNIDMHLLAGGDFSENPSEIFRDRVILVGERDSLGPGPGKPGGGVRLPFGGEGIAEGSRGFVYDNNLFHASKFWDGTQDAKR
jgi:hypothetical protein